MFKAGFELAPLAVFGLEVKCTTTEPNLMLNGCFSLHQCLLRTHVDELSHV